jgi:hypothetical protein
MAEREQTGIAKQQIEAERRDGGDQAVGQKLRLIKPDIGRQQRKNDDNAGLIRSPRRPSAGQEPRTKGPTSMKPIADGACEAKAPRSCTSGIAEFGRRALLYRQQISQAADDRLSMPV